MSFFEDIEKSLLEAIKMEKGEDFFFHKISSVSPRENNILIATFTDGTVKEYDVKLLYQKVPQFKVFEADKKLFSQVQVDAGGYGIFWNDELDLNAEDIWEFGTTVTE